VFIKNKIINLLAGGILIAVFITFGPACEKDTPVPSNNNDTIDTVKPGVIHYRPHGINESKDYTVWVNDTLVFTGEAGNNFHGFYSFCTFDFEGAVTIRVKANQSINHLEILPGILGINYQNIDSETIEFKLNEPEMITLLLNGSNDRALHFLTSLPEVDPPQPMDQNVIYYSAGKTHDVGVLELRDNQTLYIEGGARLTGMILVKDARKVKILGRGMIDGTFNESSGNHPEGDEPWRLIYMTRSNHIEIEGITLYNSLKWTIHPYSCNNLKIDNIRVLNWDYGSDGTDLSACQDVEIKNSFYRTNDDPIVIKAASFKKNAFYPNPMIQNQNVRNILIEGCTIWNMSWGNVFEIGYELRCERVSDIIFRDCDVLRQGDRGAVLSIHNADNAIVENVLYEDIRVENAAAGTTGRKLLDLAIFYSLFSYDSYWGSIEPNGHWDNLLSPWGIRGSAQFRGQIRNITYRNIQVLDGYFPYSIFHGFGTNNTVEDITIENVTVQGVKMNNAEELKLEINDYVETVQFR